jgi:hypothetical protein
MKKVILISLMAAPFLIVGCGGSSSTTATTTSAKITGTVPGTFVEAFCADGTHVTTTSTPNGTNQHPYSLTVPTNTPCRLVMTTNQNNPAQRVTTPITINGKKAVSITGDTDLGFANIPATYAEATDNNGDHVQDNDVDVAPASLNGAAVDDTNSNQFDADHNGKIDNIEDKNHNGTADGWEDRNHNGTADEMEGAGDNNSQGNDNNGGNDNNRNG